MFTQVRSANRRVTPAPGQGPEGRAVMRAVYVVLEPQYQSALTNAATSLNGIVTGVYDISVITLATCEAIIPSSARNMIITRTTGNVVVA